MAVTVPDTGFIPFAFPDLPAVRCVFTTRFAGSLSLTNMHGEERDAAIAARRALRTTLGIAAWSEVKQVHGDTFLFNLEEMPADAEPSIEADGHATSRKNHALMVKTADCQPILLAHPGGYVAAIHAGWRGNVLRFPESAVARFCREYGLEPSDVRAVRGPSLGYAEFVNFDSEWPRDFEPWYDREARCMDLWALTCRQLCEAGVKARNIYSLDLCTLSLNALFFSHRKKDTGRQAALIWSV